MAVSPSYLLALGYASDSQRNLVQSLVKTHANGWWHHLPDVWIVGGHDHKYWANLIRPALASSAARLLVLELPNEIDRRMFATRGGVPKHGRDWLWQTYYDHTPPS